MTLDVSDRALILAPQGRDAMVAAAMLSEAGMRGDVIRDLEELVAELQAGAGFSVVTEEATGSTHSRNGRISPSSS